MDWFLFFFYIFGNAGTPLAIPLVIVADYWGWLGSGPGGLIIYAYTSIVMGVILALFLTIFVLAIWSVIGAHGLWIGGLIYLLCSGAGLYVNRRI